MKDKVFEDKRLLEAVDMIDKKYISEALGYYDNMGAGKSASRRRAAYIISLAACFVMLVAAVPLLTYLIPRIGSAVGVGTTFNPAGAANSSDVLSESENYGEITYSSRDEDMSDRDMIEHVGEVPQEFIDIINQNLFADIEISRDKIIKKADEPYDIEVYDFSGNLLHRIDIKINVPGVTYYDTRIHSLSDGTYLYVAVCLASVSSQIEDATRNTRAVCFDENGDVIFDTDLGKKGYFDNFVETEDAYFLIDSSYQRRYSQFIKLDKSGKILKSIEMGGSENDSLYLVNYVGGTLYALMNNQSLTHKPHETVTVRFDSDLNVIGYSDKEDFPEIKLDARTYNYKTVSEFLESRFPDKEKEEEYPNGMSHLVTAFIEYDGFTLLVSEHDTKHYYPLLIMSSPFCFTETVYTAYAPDGTILWRTAVDSTDYDDLARLEAEVEKYHKFAD